jgi:hypothetical protein
MFGNQENLEVPADARGTMTANTRRRKAWVVAVLAMVWVAWPATSRPVRAESRWSGSRIMAEVMQRHHLSPYVFEEQTMILMDAADHLDVRQLRRFSRIEIDGSVKFLLVFDNPAEIRGVSLLALRSPGGQIHNGIYLPAFGRELKSSGDASRGSHFLGTDFALEDLAFETTTGYDYIRAPDRITDRAAYFVVEAYPQNGDGGTGDGDKSIYSLRRHQIRQDTFFIVRTDYYDRRGRFFKSQTFHDLKRVDGDMWRADMILMENHRERHKTLVKIDRRIFSRDYVPPAIFTPRWLFESRHLRDTQTGLFQDATRPPVPENAAGGQDEGRRTED